MSADLFAHEQQVYDNAAGHIKAVSGGAPCDPDQFERLTLEYGKMLKYLRRVTRLSDQTTRGLYSDNLNLLDKAFYDTVTGISNRRLLEKTLKQAVRHALRTGGLLSVLMIDIDHFKKYNDAYGHGKGDACLKAVAQALNSCVGRSGDLVARYGGEEFTALLPDTDERGARIVAEHMLKSVRALHIQHETSETAGHVTISIGATTAGIQAMMTGDELIKRADEALYQSKRSGRDRCTHTWLG